MRKVPSALEAEIAGEKAAALGRSGRTLRTALEELAEFDSGAAAAKRKARAHERDASPARRAALVAQAGEAYWSYIVQREALGLVHNDSVVEEYGIPPEVVRSMGPRLRKPQQD